jgi:hypothetical protein
VLQGKIFYTSGRTSPLPLFSSLYPQVTSPNRF